MPSLPSIALLALTLISALTLVHLHVPAHAGLIKPRTSVQITNGISDVNDLTVHYKSKQDDLGEHLIQPCSAYSFGFRPSFWGNTLFFCHMAWRVGPGGSGYFDIYDEKRDVKRCHDCCWTVRPDGPCVCSDCSIPCKAMGTCYNWKNMSESPIS